MNYATIDKELLCVVATLRECDEFVSNKELLSFNISTTFIIYPFILFTIEKTPA